MCSIINSEKCADTECPHRYDSQLQQIDGTLSTIEMQREALEGANTNTAVLTTMNDAAMALKKANNELDVDKVTIVAVIVNRFLFIHRCMT